MEHAAIRLRAAAGRGAVDDSSIPDPHALNHHHADKHNNSMTLVHTRCHLGFTSCAGVPSCFVACHNRVFGRVSGPLSSYRGWQAALNEVR